MAGKVYLLLTPMRVLCTPLESFGFKGEALSSISGISLMEIVTKTHGAEVLKWQVALFFIHIQTT